MRGTWPLITYRGLLPTTCQTTRTGSEIPPIGLTRWVCWGRNQNWNRHCCWSPGNQGRWGAPHALLTSATSFSTSPHPCASVVVGTSARLHRHGLHIHEVEAGGHRTRMLAPPDLLPSLACGGHGEPRSRPPDGPRDRPYLHQRQCPEWTLSLDCHHECWCNRDQGSARPAVRLPCLAPS